MSVTVGLHSRMLNKKVTAKGGKFILRNLTDDVRSVMDLTGFSRILTIQ